MKYEKGMPRFKKASKNADDEYEEDENGEFYKGHDGKMYRMDGGQTRKSMDDVTEDDLQKSLDRLAGMASDGDATSRKDELLSKAQSGDELTKGERDELFSLLGNAETAPQADAGDELLKGMRGNEAIQKALDVSEYLDEQHSELCKALAEVANRIEKSDQRQHEFNLVQARAIVQMGSLVKAMSERLGVIESQPARQPKSRGVRATPLQKGFGGEPPPGEQLSKSEVLDTLEAMMHDAVDKGGSGASAGGEDLLKAISKYEQFNTISRPLLQEVQAYRRQQRGAAAN
jgi:hypothetical protein